MQNYGILTCNFREKGLAKNRFGMGKDISKKVMLSKQAEYLQIQKLKEGYLIVFNANKGSNKAPTAEWIKVGDKRIFDVLV